MLLSYFMLVVILGMIIFKNEFYGVREYPTSLAFFANGVVKPEDECRQAPSSRGQIVQ